ncbi:MAG: hypothetical protein HY356_01865 [Gammaproteobacteria bacterium]|nr:hypothetical protein [Gammaproteobacteria bacterium]
MNRYLLITLLFLFSPSILAEETTNNECKPLVEINIEWQTLRIRPHENAFLNCTVSREQYNELIRGALENPADKQANFKSLFMGRLIDHPWISKFLAMQALDHEGWDAEKGQPKAGDMNSFVRKLLSFPELLKQIQEPFIGTGYTVIGASIEKVLVAKANEIKWLEINEPVLVPYDAMVHYILKKHEDD